MKKLVRAALAFSMVFCSAPALAIPDFLAQWQARYPESRSDDAQCQLCHQDPGGNEPWNTYGWDLRDVYNGNGFDFDAAMDIVEFTDHDSDDLEASSLDEITWDFQPGWRAGAVNSVFMANGTEITNQSPPMLPPTTALDFPTILENPIPDIESGITDINLVEIANGFNAPVKAVTAPGINGSLFVVEQTGRIFRVDLTTGAKTLFHNVSSDLVSISPGYDERGLLGLTFHPNYQTNGLFYTYQSEPVRAAQNSAVDFSTVVPNFTPNHRSMVVEYKASNPSCNSSIAKRDTLMIIDQPQSNHNGGDLVFGPDGDLYISLGDGGAANDQGPGHNLRGTGRDNTNVLGSIIRIEPLGTNSANGKYGIPDDNPFIGNGDTGEDEIFAYGFRNPYRMSFDAGTGELYTGDVGQNEIEEANLVEKGGNYGWNYMEGSFYFYNSGSNPGSGNYVSTVAPPNAPGDLQSPVGEYDHDDGISITGGYVYRGTEISEAAGHYVFGDFSGPSFVTATGRLFYLDLGTNVISEFLLDTALQGYVTGFGQDANNELYVVTNDQFNPSGIAGKLLRLADPAVPPSYPDASEESATCPPDEDLCVPIKSQNGGIAMVCL